MLHESSPSISAPARANTHHAHRVGDHVHPSSEAPPVSLLRMSLAVRLGIAVLALAVMWLAVFVAMR